MPVPDIQAKSWDKFLSDFKSEWKPGQHIAIIAPTGQGKTTVLVSLLDQCRNFVLGFDPKGGDDTLAKTGFPRLPHWPPPAKAYDKMARGEPVKFLVGPKIAKLADRPILAAVQAAALEGAFDDRGWTVAIDELQIAADKMGQADAIDNLLISARTRKVSVVSLFQRPANVPRSAYEMSSWIFLGLTLDVDTINRLAEIVGRPKYEIRGAVNGLARVDYSWLILPNNPRRPMILTLPREPEKTPKTERKAVPA
jgi:energy-coupling factor transporter ATP-binding protein EcfA2